MHSKMDGVKKEVYATRLIVTMESTICYPSRIFYR